MATLTFDTYDFIQTLKHSGIKEEQARAIADGMKTIDFNHVATKDDIFAVKQDITNLRNEMLKQKVDLIQWMIGLLFLQAGLIITIMKLIH
jgi:hypothetical protein